jgi:PKD repeat protein
MKRILLQACVSMLFTAAVMSVSAQHDHFNCKTTEMHELAKRNNPDIARHEQERDEFLANFLANYDERDLNDTVIIPIVFHVIHQGGVENISDAQILDQMRILNEDYNKLNADTSVVLAPFRAIIANCHFEFRLAQVDPYGNCTNGIDRIYSPETNIGDDGSKLNPWMRDRYLNVWVVNTMENGVAGYAYYPSATIDYPMATVDGIIILHDYIGSIGTANPNRSRALTHEIGHYLDLAHTWGSTNDPTVACGDDAVADTPLTKGHDNCTQNDLWDFTCNALPADTTYRYKFTDVTPTSGTTDPTNIVESPDNNRFAFSAFTAHGVSSDPITTGSFGFTTWGTGAPDQATTYAELSGNINNADYYEFTVTPDGATSFTLNTLTFTVKRNATGVRAYAVRSSQDNFAANLPASVTPANVNLAVQTGNVFFIKNDIETALNGSTITFNANTSSFLHAPVTIRIYAWSAEDTDGSFEVDNVQLNGSFGQIENTQNYMEYSYCSHMFTEGQKTRMLAALWSTAASRRSLWSDASLAYTGVLNDPAITCAPKADFYSDKRMVCIGNSVQFRDNSVNGTPESWMWTFQDGNPATSNAENPTVSFTSGGWKAVTLTVMNAQGSTTKTVQKQIYVSYDWSDLAGPIQENFSAYPNLDNFWLVNNIRDNSSFWKYSNTVGYSGNTSMMLNAYEVDVTDIDTGDNDQDELITPSMNLSNLASNGQFTFQYSYATRGSISTDITEKLEVFSSTDCGKTWSSRLVIEGLELAAGGNSAGFYIPNSPTNWTQATFPIPASLRVNGTRFKFVFTTSSVSNNLYIDDINITGTVSVEELENDFDVNVYPNPVNANSVISLTTTSEDAVVIRLIDITGKEVAVVNQNKLKRGTYTFPIGNYDLPAGMYFITAQAGNRKHTMKFVVNH